MAGPYFIGIDGGTEGIRAGIFDARGRPLAFAATPYTTRFPAPAHAEQDPVDWWAGCGQSVRKAMAAAGIPADQVKGLAVDTTNCSVVLLDTEGEPVRPAMIWMDVRASKEADEVAASGDKALRVNSGGRGPVSAEWMIPKALWLKRNEPDAFARAAYVCEYQDYLNLKLTGRLVASVYNVSARWHHDVTNGSQPTSLIDSLGIGELATKWPGEIVRLGEVVAPLSAEAANHLGLKAGLPVSQGGADAGIGMIGLGVIRPGSLAFITGSSHLHLGLSEKPFAGEGIWGTYANALLPGLHLVEGGQASTGSAINWFKRTLAAETSYKTLDEEAAAVPAGANGLTALDHFQGNRTPFTDPHSRGAFAGLSLGHGRGHLFRALLESVAMGSRLILDTFEKGGFTLNDIVLAGGVTNSPLWLQIHADIIGKPIALTEVPDAPALGSAILAAVGSGHYANITEAVSAMVRRSRTIEPNMAVHGDYAEPYARYKALYITQKDFRKAVA
ncbi:FGGY-family carbohydrate kinase [Pseudokordiimonas caeni]|uniref:FGGY-family carbohydrate kinase n=1 Tax=Pseudokordiimonas caeni TaxID=2997908 RepID=UPI0028119E6A|nr:FGGY-family carbohydrate kinase [Pseudokordiimonas caeni]